MRSGYLIISGVVLLSCAPVAARTADDPSSSCSAVTRQDIAESVTVGLSNLKPERKGSDTFWEHWADGNAEISSYQITLPRYGAMREGKVVLIYVKEPMNSATWIKDDTGTVPQDQVVKVLKLNNLLSFRTGIYDYSVMTSVFAPINSTGLEPFSPAKISFSSQEWCGQVYHHIYPKSSRFHSVIHSYFSKEGDRRESVDTAPFTLYEDALLIQLRELDGPFAGGKDWSGQLVPALWFARKDHVALRPVPATIRREKVSREGIPVTRFTLRYDGKTRTFDVERAHPRRVLGWSASDGTRVSLVKTARLPYWKLNGPGGEADRTKVGLEP